VNLVLGEHFKRDERRRHSEWLRKRQWFIKAKETRAKKEEMAAQADEELLSFAAGAIAATSIEIEKFEAKLDTYDEGIVIALMENTETLDRVNAELNVLLSRAHVIEDGRRVFKTEDGTQVFDEFGDEVLNDVVQPEAILDDKPTWETYSQKLETKVDLSEERKQIFNFQEKVDAARERVADGEISTHELDNLDSDLAEAMPQSVKSYLPVMVEVTTTPKLSSEFSLQSRQPPGPVEIPNHIPSASPGLHLLG